MSLSANGDLELADFFAEFFNSNLVYSMQRGGLTLNQSARLHITRIDRMKKYMQPADLNVDQYSPI